MTILNKNKLYFLFLICLSLISCKTKLNIIGTWENIDRKLVFDGYDNFIIEYKNSNQIQAFRGSYYQKNNIIVLIFDEYKTIDNSWISTDTTSLAGYKESLEVSITDDELYTKIVSTGKHYSYTRVK